MIERPDIETLMAGGLGVWLSEQETMREDAKRSTSNRRFLVIGAVGVLAIFALILFRIEFQTVIWAVFVLGLAGLLWAELPKKRAVKTVKVGINDAIAEAIGLTYEHDCEAGTPFELACACKLLPSYDRANFEDKWSGEIGGVPFMLHEAHLEERRGSGKNRHWVTVFRGIVMSIGYNRHFHSTTLLVRDNAHRGFFFTKRDSIKVAGMALDYADMTHPEFEEMFDIYTTDQVEARYLIDPLYVERLIALERSYRGKDVATIFHDGSVVVTLKSNNMFESGHIDAANDRDRIQTTIDQFARIADLARQLNEREPRTDY